MFSVAESLANIFLLSALPLLCAQNVPTTCYSIDGSSGLDSGFRCDNTTTGHSTCCAAGAICYSNGVCQQSNGPVQDYLRVGCTDKTWKDPACLEQCTHLRETEKQESGSVMAQLHLQINTVVTMALPVLGLSNAMPARQQSSTSSTSSFSTTTTSSSSSASTATASTTLVSAPSQSTSETPPPTSTQTDDGKSTNTAAIGAGVGVPVGAIALGLIAFLAWRHRKKNTRKGGRLVDDMDGGYTPADNTASPAQELHRVNPVAVATRDRKSFEGGLEYNGPLPSTRELEEGREYDGSSPPIRELDGTSAVHELEGSGAQKWL
ncbi:hypothetical protein GLAREA_00928 [Glarea lozoyensis ATCC 20868]|uniref:Mid2 domain-containing protein n=1 Tax=Glarea lozoyensis (strain ATCC 20868 / MF5171) TaxID=1116229 RepID=S3DTP7_GLAL2|nr:uncharacterized protein GLAREA_00928 [Glarea lozoyensis ATCC 20868]EPE29768.1 hypothetical protein GLAREA_00928 [Glarea lozoyensis ATCC 20868]